MFFNKTCTLTIESRGHGILKDGRKIPMIITQPLFNKKLAKKLFQEKQFEDLQFSYLRKVRAVQLAFQSGKNKMSIGFDLTKDLEALCSIVKEKHFVMVLHETQDQLTMELDLGVNAFQKQFREEVMGDHLRNRLKKENKTVDDFDQFTTLMIDHYAKDWDKA